MQVKPEGFISEERLVEQAAGGDYDAFEQLVERHAGGVYHLALKMLHNPADAEEVLQETFLSAYTHMANFRRQSSFKTWLYRIAANHALTRLRKDKGKLEQWLDDEAELVTTDRSSDPEVAAEDEELRRRLIQAMDALPPAYRPVFWLRDVEGLSTQEVADVLGLELANVKTRLLRARLKLRELLADYVGETA
ncbi:sigma-70 family RNA polymerase sigma factor [bacterium CPR1]|nr:sigma-70 family RNA polymerase sigma factor [bacterium CPR1]